MPNVKHTSRHGADRGPQVVGNPLITLARGVEVEGAQLAKLLVVRCALKFPLGIGGRPFLWVHPLNARNHAVQRQLVPM